MITAMVVLAMDGGGANGTGTTTSPGPGFQVGDTGKGGDWQTNGTSNPYLVNYAGT